jgi:hypothetical protein
MSVLEYLAKVDLAAVQFERAKREMEVAKMNFDRSKQTYEEVLTQAEALGLSKAKLKRVAEERVAALLESGLIDLGKESHPVTKKATVEGKTDKVAKSKKKGRVDSDESQHATDKTEADISADMASDLSAETEAGAGAETDDFDAEAFEAIGAIEAKMTESVEANA